MFRFSAHRCYIMLDKKYSGFSKFVSLIFSVVSQRFEIVILNLNIFEIGYSFTCHSEKTGMNFIFFIMDEKAAF